MLLVEEYAATQILISALRNLTNHEHRMSRINACLLTLMLFPENPTWIEHLYLVESTKLLRATGVALRFHMNSSTLWRLRSQLVGSSSISCQEEVEFLVSLSDFKKFNYHLFEHWCSIISGESFLGCHVRPLLAFIRRNPTNFSPFNVLLKGIKICGLECEGLCTIFDELCSQEAVAASSAFRQFIVSLAFSFDRQMLDSCTALQPHLHRFQSDISVFS